MSTGKLWSILVIVLLTAYASITFSQIPRGFGINQEFNQLTVNNGLSQNSVTSIIQDKSGFIWIGTYDGLNRFDGLQVKNFRHQSSSAHSLPDNRILALCALNNGNLLIGTEGGGLSLYNQKKQEFLPLTLKHKQQHVKSVLGISKTKEENIWVAEREQIHYIEKITDRDLKGTNISFVEKGNVLRIFTDSKSNLWAGTDNGLYLLKYPLSANTGPVKVAEGHVSSLFEDKDKNIWYGGYGNLGIIKKEGDRIIDMPSLYTNLKLDIFRQNSNLLISAVTQDNLGNVYLSTDQNGVLICALNNKGELYVKGHFYSSSQYAPLPEDNVNTCFIDETNTLWIGTFQNGVTYNSLNPKNIYSFLPLIGAKSGKYISSVFYHNENIWIGTMDKGLWRYDTKNGSYAREKGIKSRSILCFFYDAKSNSYYAGGDQGFYILDKSKNWKKLLDKTVRSICTDKFGRLWLATWQGILIFTPSTGNLVIVTEKNGLSSNMGYVLLQERGSQTIWCGTIGGGLNKISYTTNGISSIKNYTYKENGRGISNNHIWCLYEDKKGNIWAGTDAGLNFINKQQQISQLSLPEIANIKITSITEDTSGDFWIGTGNGLVHYKSNGNKLKFFRHNDGLLSNTITEAIFKTLDGTMLIGTINGLNSFLPRAIQNDQYPAKVALTALSIYGKTINPGDRLDDEIILEENINDVGKINLKHNQNNLSITAAALHFAAPKSNRIRYKLDGYDKNWIEIEAGTATITYSHLPAGKYKLLITAANNDGLWSTQTKELHLNISPSPWLSWWAKTIYGFVLLVIGWFFYREYLSRKNMKQQVFLEKYEKEKMVELNELKLDFFTKITHDLRTPLSLIIGPTTDIAENAGNQSAYVSDRIGIIHKNATRLLTLINQILDFRKISDGSIFLNLQKDSIEEVVMEAKNAFTLLAETRSITLTSKIAKPNTETWIDREKLEKVLYNLISNAFNHTDDGGCINISIDFEKRNGKLWANINIEDNGKGIDPIEVEHIFEMYYQGKRTGNKGSGIGLAVAKKLTELQKGEIKVQSIIEKGSTFTISIPVSSIENDILPPNIGQNPLENISSLPSSVPAKESILILEDEPDLLNYLSDTLSDYHVIKAETVEAALVLIKKQQPHLIISDLMLPDMDGKSFLKLIKNDAKTAHIPVIMHTVKYDRETIKQLMDSGADDFIPKPTNYGDLKRKVRNILTTRKKLIENLHNHQIIDPHYGDLPSANEDFLLKIIKYIEQNISNPDFSVEKLSSEMAMSRMNLHRKLDAAIGKTASELIREIRMKKAGQLLASGSYRISEVMFEVGISSNHYFNKYFKEMYGVTAKEYIIQHLRK